MEYRERAIPRKYRRLAKNMLTVFTCAPMMRRIFMPDLDRYALSCFEIKSNIDADKSVQFASPG